jgi:hypothetical protein
VYIDRTAPSVSILSPTTATNGSSIIFSVTAADNATYPNAGVKSCYFYWTGINQSAMQQSGNTWSASFTPNSTGTFSAYANCSDAARLWNNNPTLITVSEPAETVSPQVTITSPINDATVNETITITATASDNVGVAKVEFYVGGVLKSTVASAPYVYSWDTTTVTNGNYVLVAKAYDAAGNTNTSSVSVTVNNVIYVPPTGEALTSLIIVAPVNQTIFTVNEKIRIHAFANVPDAAVSVRCEEIVPLTPAGNKSYIGDCVFSSKGRKKITVTGVKGSETKSLDVDVQVVPPLELVLLSPVGVLCEGKEAGVSIAVKKEGTVVENAQVTADGTMLNYGNGTYEADFFIVPNMQLTITASDGTVNKTKTFLWNTTNKLSPVQLNASVNPGEMIDAKVYCGVYESPGNYTLLFVGPVRVERKAEKGLVQAPEVAGLYNITVYGKSNDGREINETKTIEIKSKNNNDFLYFVVGGVVITVIAVYLLFLR